MTPPGRSSALQALGFGDSGVIISRSIMLPELSALRAVAPLDADAQTYERGVEDGATHNASAAIRLKTFNDLKLLYALKPGAQTAREFRLLRLMFPSDLPAMEGAPTFARKPLLCSCAVTVLGTQANTQTGVTTPKLERDEQLSVPLRVSGDRVVRPGVPR
jgi:hypothetical protein